MPELPEVETTCRAIRAYIEKQVVTKVIIRQPKLRWLIPSSFANILHGQEILTLQRRAKYMLFNTKHGTLIIHLGMSGSLLLMTKDKYRYPEKHDHVDILLNNNYGLRYRDPRRFGSIHWTEDVSKHRLIDHLGLEPLSSSFTGKYLYEKSLNRKLAIKLFIMDNKVVVGVGNIYANESLFLSGINPSIAANELSLDKYNLLTKKIKQTLQLAIKQGGTTLKDFASGTGKPGYFSQSLTVYGRQGQSCILCNDKLISKRIGQRITIWCPSCQYI